MRYPGDLLYFMKFVGADVMIVAAAVLVVILATVWHFLRRKGEKDG